jgi:hypothetical protein
MDIYHAYFDLKPGVRDMALVEALDRYMVHLKAHGLVEGHRLTRAKLGFGLRGMGDWHLMMEFRDLAQFDAAFKRVAGRAEPAEGYHFGVNSLVHNVTFALTRDFPDPVRQRGEERF